MFFNFSRKKFLYLIQTPGILPKEYNVLNNKESDILYITWKEQVNGIPFAPNSTWTEGRNSLLEIARSLEKKYEYYIFLDDDLTLSFQNIIEFQKLLKKYKPAIGTPRMWDYNKQCENLNFEAHTVYAFDAAMNAFHNSVFFENAIFPYTEKFDDESWWYSQLIMLHLAHINYSSYILQFNNIIIDNLGHSEYPKENNFKKIEDWIKNEFLNEDQKILNHPTETRAINVTLPKKPLKNYSLDKKRK